MNVTIAPLADNDVDALCELASIVWRQHYPPIIGASQTEYMLAQRYVPCVIRAELAAGNVWWDVLSRGDEMIAFVSSFPAGAQDEMKLDKLYVRPDQQRHGYGGMLIAHTCERAKHLGYRTVTLAVNKRNTKEIAAYRKHGFDIRETSVKEIGGGFIMDDYIMAKSVSAFPSPADRTGT
ncbi:MAG TPA: GNAT family N-acetyltransferase [Burkholderiales bacterium]|nr:GNAT family N-acetyltransferase [Burkholderiales bacterium]